QLVYLCTNPTGQARMVSDSAACRGNETLVIFNTEGQQGPPGQQGPSGPQGPPGPANRVFSGSVSANGHPQETGFSVEHTAQGFYRLIFWPGTFSGNEGEFLLATVTPFGNPAGTNTSIVTMASVGPIQENGSGFFAVQFATDLQFSFVVAVRIS